MSVSVVEGEERTGQKRDLTLRSSRAIKRPVDCIRDRIAWHNLETGLSSGGHEFVPGRGSGCRWCGDPCLTGDPGHLTKETAVVLLGHHPRDQSNLLIAIPLADRRNQCACRFPVVSGIGEKGQIGTGSFQTAGPTPTIRAERELAIVGGIGIAAIDRRSKDREGGVGYLMDPRHADPDRDKGVRPVKSLRGGLSPGQFESGSLAIRSDLAHANRGLDPEIQLSISHEREYAVACVMVIS